MNCNNCIFWDYMSGDTGRCKAMENGEFNDKIEIIVEPEYEIPFSFSVETDRNFNCTLYKYREIFK